MLSNMFNIIITVSIFYILYLSNYVHGQSETSQELYNIEGKVTVPNMTTSWLAETVVHLKGGEAIGFIR